MIIRAWKKNRNTCQITGSRMIRMAILLTLFGAISLFAGCEKKNDAAISDIMNMEDTQNYSDLANKKNGLIEKMNIPEDAIIQYTDDSSTAAFGTTNSSDTTTAPDSTASAVSQTDSTDNIPVILPNSDKAGIYQLERVKMDSAFMTRIAEAVFDGGSYKIIWPGYVFPLAERQKQLEALKKEFDEATNNPNNEETFLSHFRVYNDYQSYSEGIETDDNTSPDIDKYVVEHLPDELTLYPNGDGHTMVSAEGTFNEKAARISFEQTPIDETTIMQNIIFSLDYDWEDHACYNVIDGVTLGKTIVGKNSCRYSKEEAKEIADEFISRLNIGDYVIPASDPLDKYLVYSSNSVSDSAVSNNKQVVGYSFTYTMDVDGIPVIPSEFSVYFNCISGSHLNTITILVNDDGILECQICDPMTISKVETEDSSLLTYDKLKEFSEEKNYANVSWMEFGYYQVYEDGISKLVPSWSFIIKDYLGKYTLCIINAITGEELDPFYNFSYVDD